MGANAVAETTVSGESVREVGGEVSQGCDASSLAALCLIARFHQVAAEPATLEHQMGLQPSKTIGADELLRAAKYIGLKAKLKKTTPVRVSILVQCDGQRILITGSGGWRKPPHHRAGGGFRQPLDRRVNPDYRSCQPGRRVGQFRLLLVHPQPRQISQAVRRGVADLLHAATLCAGQSAALPGCDG